MLYFPKLNILNLEFYGLWDFKDVGGGVRGFGELTVVVLNQDL